ncbi:MAG: phytanoyl-CoA dioxygenase family protein [Candidatus Poribacteria bacterium]|nr:phytanoyl-CoA dioxygenase family protein [Candidatus Poribacteria bacterium]
MPTIRDEWKTALAAQGYFVVPRLLDLATVASIRRTILDFLNSPVEGKGNLDQESFARGKSDLPYDPTNIRKLGQMGRHTEAIWDGWLTNPDVLEIVRYFTGKDALLKFDSVFLKPAKVGGATPWHQDIGLWRDTDHTAANGWVALDPATRENGCMQFVRGSHLGEVVPHIAYEDSIHGELPRELVAGVDVDHIELEPGDAVFWHSNLWHYSPPNPSDRRRIATAAVWSQLGFAQSARRWRYLWAMRDGQPCPFPGEPYDPPYVDEKPAPPFEKAPAY